MSNTIHYTQCPVCDSTDISVVANAKDFTISNEMFAIAACANCSLMFTQDVPDAESIGPYYKSEAYISHTDSSKGFINKLYHSVRKRTLKAKRKMIIRETGIEKGKLLDIGSGTGAFANEMKETGWEVTGLEPDADARTVAKKLYGLELETMQNLFSLPAGSFQAITLWHVLEHVHELNRYMQQMKNLLAENGRLFIAVPNYTSADASSYKENWAAWDVPRHLYHFSPKAMQVLVEKHGMKILKHQPMWYDSFYVSMLSSKYKNGKTNLLGAVFTGMRSNMKALGDTKKCSSVIYIIGK